jgi:hypothetical protein
MRAFFAILLLSNLGLLAYQLWNVDPAPSFGTARDLNAEKIRVLDSARLPMQGPDRPSHRTEAAAPPPAEPATVPAAGASCLEWGTFESSTVAAAEELLKQRLPEIRYTRESPEGVARFWVFIPSAGSAEETEARLQRLQRKGAGDVVVVRDDPELRGAVSLGIYSSAAAAQRRMAELDRLRIRGARVLERKTGGNVALLLLREVDPAVRPNLETLVGEVANTELRAVECPVVRSDSAPES